MTLKHDVRAVARQFQICGEFLGAAPYGTGHINDTYCASFSQGGAPVRYILQRINHNVFKNPVALMENVQRVTAHLAGKVAGEPDSSRRVLTLIPTRDGRAWHCDAEGNYWRTYIFIEKARTYDAIESPKQAFEAAKAFGGSRNCSPISRRPACTTPSRIFTTRRRRFARLENVIAADSARRVRLAGRRSTLRSGANASPDYCSTRACPNASPTTTPSSTTSCSTTPPAKASA